MRLIDYLLQSGLAPDERTARGLILRGDVLVNEVAQHSEHFELQDSAAVRVRGDLSGAVSRGFAKLDPVLERLNFAVDGRVCLDLGVSTGGFTQALLQRGAAKVYAVDVAYGVTALEVRDDPRVLLLERTNARELNADLVPERVERVVGDLSFISWRAVLPALCSLLADDAELLLLAKPQFELAAHGAAGELSRGVASGEAHWRSALLSLAAEWQRNGLTVLSIVPAAVRGARGNQEFFVYLHNAGAGVSLGAYTAMLEQAIEECGL